MTLLTELRADRAAAVTAYGLISGPSAAQVASYNAAIAAWDAAIDAVDIDDSELMSDIHASADYRAHLITEITKRAVRAL